MDSLVTLNLTINNSTLSSVNIISCGSGNFNGNILTNPGIYTDTLNGYYGCDSIIIVNLSQSSGCTDPTSFNYDSLAVCDDGSRVPLYTDVLILLH